MKGIRTAKIPSFTDDRGVLSVVELKDYVDFPIERFYFLTNARLPRGGHCVKGEKKLYVMMKGSCKAKIFDGSEWAELELRGPEDVLIMEDDLWREFEDFSDDAVLGVLSNLNYDKNLYILSLSEYEKFKNQE